MGVWWKGSPSVPSDSVMISYRINAYARLHDLVVRTASQVRALGRGQDGFSGLDLGIACISILAAALIYSFAVVKTGIPVAERTEEAVSGGLERTSVVLSARGHVSATANEGLTAIEKVTFLVVGAAQSTGSVEISTSVVTYFDQHQSLNVPRTDWAADWLIGSGPLLDPGEAIEVEVDLTGLTTPVTTLTAFKIQFIPTTGTVVVIERTTPDKLARVFDLG